jgi:hypothetical protein
MPEERAALLEMAGNYRPRPRPKLGPKGESTGQNQTDRMDQESGRAA